MRWKIFQHYKNGKKLKKPIVLLDCGFDHIDKCVNISSGSKILMELYAPEIRLCWKGVVVSGPEKTSDNTFKYQELWCIVVKRNEEEA